MTAERDAPTVMDFIYYNNIEISTHNFFPLVMTRIALDTAKSKHIGMYNISFSNPAIAYSVCLRTYGGDGSACGSRGGIVIIIINPRLLVRPRWPANVLPV